MKEKQDQLPIRDSYGYIEFLYHSDYEGKPRTNYFLPCLVGPSYTKGTSDFKIFPYQDKKAICEEFYQLVGQLVGIAATFSFQDLHTENLVVSKYKPHLIDLEVSLTSPKGDIETTLLFDKEYGAITSIKGAPILTYPEWSCDDELYINPKNISENKQNRLWMAGSQVPIKPEPYYVEDILSGLKCIIDVMKNFDDFGGWFQRMENVLVRYLPKSTADFQNSLYASKRDNPTFTTEDLEGEIKKICAYYVDQGYDKWKSTNGDPKFYALAYDHIKLDFLNGDVPCFYHRIGTTDIMDSWGKKVEVSDTVSYESKTTNVNLDRNTFFPKSPLESRVKLRLEDLKDDAKRGKRLNELTKQVKEKLGCSDSKGTTDLMISKNKKVV